MRERIIICTPVVSFICMLTLNGFLSVHAACLKHYTRDSISKEDVEETAAQLSDYPRKRNCYYKRVNLTVVATSAIAVKSMQYMYGNSASPSYAPAMLIAGGAAASLALLWIYKAKSLENTLKPLQPLLIRLSQEARLVKDKGKNPFSVAVQQDGSVRLVPYLFSLHPCPVLAGKHEEPNYKLMEDHSAMLLRKPTNERSDEYNGYYAIFDGHGGLGEVPRVLKAGFPVFFNQELLAGRGPQEALCNAFKAAHTGLPYMSYFQNVFDGLTLEGTESGLSYTGSTALILFVTRTSYFVANLGDCRAVLSRGGRAQALSKDHRPGQKKERASIEARGGRVEPASTESVARCSGLAVSRVFGDLTNIHVGREPEVTKTERTGTDNFIILGSDGLWDFIANQRAVEIVSTNLKEKGSTATGAAKLLVDEAIRAGSLDNVTAMVVRVDSASCSAQYDTSDEQH